MKVKMKIGMKVQTKIAPTLWARANSKIETHSG